jgi:hypothetical protein
MPKASMGCVGDDVTASERSKMSGVKPFPLVLGTLALGSWTVAPKTGPNVLAAPSLFLPSFLRALVRRGLLAVVVGLAALLLSAPLVACSLLSPSGTVCVGVHDASTYNTSGPRAINSGLICP